MEENANGNHRGMKPESIATTLIKNPNKDTVMQFSFTNSEEDWRETSTETSFKKTLGETVTIGVSAGMLNPRANYATRDAPASNIVGQNCNSRVSLLEDGIFQSYANIFIRF